MRFEGEKRILFSKSGRKTSLLRLVGFVFNSHFADEELIHAKPPVGELLGGEDFVRDGGAGDLKVDGKVLFADL